MSKDMGVAATPPLSHPFGAEPVPVSGKAGIANADRPWTHEMALAVCRIMERIAPQFGAHIGLTGGLLYKDGPRKDCDVLVYRIRQAPEIDCDGLFAALAAEGIEKTGGFGWCHKANWHGLPMDIFFPEEPGEYEGFDAEAHAIDMSFEEVRF